MFKYAKTKAEKDREEQIEERKSRLKSLTCKYCHKVLSSTRCKKRHEQQMHVRNPKKLFICKKCSKYYCTFTSLYYHRVTTCGHDTLFKCRSCDEKFKVYRQFLSHTRTLHLKRKEIEVTVKCNKCNKQVRRKNIIRHKMDVHGYTTINTNIGHSPLYPYKCARCIQVFKRRDHLKEHVATHENVKKNICPECPKAFQRKQHLTRHIRGNHENEKHLCSTCSKTFTQKSNMKQHLKMCKTEENLVYKH